MYLHIGNGEVIRYRDIIGIFDMETATVSKHTRQFLADAEKRQRVVVVADDLPKSFVVGQNADGEERVYVVQLAPMTLKRRMYAQTLSTTRRRSALKTEVQQNGKSTKQTGSSRV